MSDRIFLKPLSKRQIKINHFLASDIMNIQITRQTATIEEPNISSKRPSILKAPLSSNVQTVLYKSVA